MRSNLKLVPLQVAGKWAYTKQSGRGAARWVEIFGNFYKIACMVVFFFFSKARRQARCIPHAVA